VIDSLFVDGAFLRFERPDGSLSIVGLLMFGGVWPIEIARYFDHKDPYDVLGIPLTATDAEVHEAYHRAISAVHPDRVQSLGLPGDFLEMATRRAAQINDAYRKIRAVRKAELAGTRGEPAA
jgi:DnaJ-domain-containing protein 1